MALTLSRRESSTDELTDLMRDRLHALLVLVCVLGLFLLASVLAPIVRLRRHRPLMNRLGPSRSYSTSSPA